MGTSAQDGQNIHGPCNKKGGQSPSSAPCGMTGP